MRIIRVIVRGKKTTQIGASEFYSSPDTFAIIKSKRIRGDGFVVRI